MSNLIDYLEKRKDEIVFVNVTKEQKADLKTLADMNQTSMAQLVRHQLANLLRINEWEIKKHREDMKELEDD